MTRPQRGMMVGPKVRLLEPLVQGGMGTVWIGEHLTLRTQVAVKFVAAERLQSDPALLGRFLREASLSAQIKNPHVVRTFDHGVTDEGIPFIVMELLEGETLRERLESRGPLGVRQTARLVRQVAQALSAAHARGIVHRDIKPANLFLVAQPEISLDEHGDDELFVKVLDFGIAKQRSFDVSLETMTGTMVGTPSYMSPEQALSGKDVDHRADLWALAVVAYHCLTGELPFQGETLGSLCVAIDHGSFAPPSAHDGVPERFDGWFARALHRDIAQRFESARELSASFSRALQGRPDPAPTQKPSTLSGTTTPSDSVPPPPSASRRFGVYAASAVLLGGLAMWSNLRPAPVAAGVAAAGQAAAPVVIVQPARDRANACLPEAVASAAPADPRASGACPVPGDPRSPGAAANP